MAQTFTAAMALVKSNGVVIGKAKDIRYSENYRRVPVVGIGTIFASDQPVVGFDGTVSVSLMEISFKSSGVPDAIKRKFPNIFSQVLSGGLSFEDQIVLDSQGVSLDLFKKVTDVIDPVTKLIKPKLEPYASIPNIFITGDGFSISEGAIVTRDQSFVCLTPIVYLK